MMNETNAERLKSIKKREDLYIYRSEDREWLIEQAEQAHKFEERLKKRGLYTKRLKLRLADSEELARNRLSKNYSIQSHFDSSVKLLESYQAENERFREALSNIKDEEEQNLEGYESSIYKIARQALEVESRD